MQSVVNYRAGHVDLSPRPRRCEDFFAGRPRLHVRRAGLEGVGKRLSAPSTARTRRSAGTLLLPHPASRIVTSLVELL